MPSLVSFMATKGRPLRLIPIGLAVCAAFCGPTLAAEGDICPAHLETRQSAKAPYPYQLVPSNDASPLMGITFYDGDPKDEASLAPESEKKLTGTTVSTWKFATENKRGIFVRCSYLGTSLQLQRRLVPPPGTCTVTYDDKASTGGLPTILKIMCK
jgi:hypothetical protein